MFEDITKTKKEEQKYINATILVDGNEYKIKVYNVNMTAGTVVGFIQDDTRRIDGYTDYKISIPIHGTNCDWSFPVMVVRVDSETLKFYTPGA